MSCLAQVQYKESEHQRLQLRWELGHGLVFPKSHGDRDFSSIIFLTFKPMSWSTICQEVCPQLRCNAVISAPRSSCLSTLGGRLQCSAAQVCRFWGRRPLWCPAWKIWDVARSVGKAEEEADCYMRLPFRCETWLGGEKGWLQLDNDFVWSGNTWD